MLRRRGGGIRGSSEWVFVENVGFPKFGSPRKRFSELRKASDGGVSGGKEAGREHHRPRIPKRDIFIRSVSKNYPETATGVYAGFLQMANNDGLKAALFPDPQTGGWNRQMPTVRPSGQKL